MINFKILIEPEDERKYNFIKEMVDKKKMTIVGNYILCEHISCRDCILESSTCSQYRTTFTAKYPELTL